MTEVDSAAHAVIIKLIISYTLVGAFMVVVILTLLSLIGIRVLKDTKVRNRLYAVLVIQLAAGCVAVMFDFLKVNPSAAVQEIKEPYAQKEAKLESEVKELSEEASFERAAKEARIDELSNMVAEIESTRNGYLQEIDRLKTDLEQNKMALEESEDALMELSQALEQFDNRNELMAAIERLSRDKEELGNALELAETRIEDLTGELTQAKEVISAQRTALKEQ